MKNVYLLITLIALGIQTSFAQEKLEKVQVLLEQRYKELNEKQIYVENKVQVVSKETKKNSCKLKSLSDDNIKLHRYIDSLRNENKKLSTLQASYQKDFDRKIEKMNNLVISNQSVVESHILWGGIIFVSILLVLLIIYYYLIKRIKQEGSSIDEVRKAQDVLQSAQTEMQEESIKLDNKLIELFEKQMPSDSNTASAQIDHSLALKVADEIVRIEVNLSRMDSSIKGYKQLSKAVQRIKDNFKANGYEIVDLLGKPYNAGMKAAVTFIADESLESGQQLITKIIKPQINYQQQMIQAAQIEVSQPE